MEFYQGYSGGQATVIGSVLVTNLKNRKKKRWLAQSRDCLYVIPDEVINSLIEEEITVNVAGGFVAIRASRRGAYSDFDLYRKRVPLNFIKGKMKVGVSYYSSEDK
ncbi:hypothetical protein ACFX13_009949 [Malus domestica]